VQKPKRVHWKALRIATRGFFISFAPPGIEAAPHGRLVVLVLTHHLAGGIMGLPSARAVNQGAAVAVAVEDGAEGVLCFMGILSQMP